MLTPEYLAHCTDYILGLYDELDRAIIADIARRIVKTGGITATAEHQIDKVQQSGMLLNDVTKQIAAVSGLAEEEIRRLFQEAGITGLQNDARPLILSGKQTEVRLSRQMEQLLRANISKTGGELRNLTMTTGATAANAYLEAVNAAFMKVQSGAFSYQQAIRDAVKAAAEDGNYVSYPSGHRDQLDVAVRRSVLTGLNQTAAKLTEMYSAEMGAEYYEVSAHAGARPSHTRWQGRVFKISGSTAEYPNFADSTGYGTGDGLCGWNCRHSFYPFWPGLSLPAYTPEMLEEYDRAKYHYDGRDLTEYEVSQLMRKSERDIRKTKREIAGYRAAMEATDDPTLKGTLQDDFDRASVKLKEQEEKYKSLCRETHHAPDSTRTGVAAIKDDRGNIVSWNRSTAQRARYGAERVRNLVQIVGKNSAQPSNDKQLERRLSENYNVFKTFNLTSKDTIKPYNLAKKLNSNEYGAAVLKYLEDNGIQVTLCYGADNPKHNLGTYDSFADTIYIHCDVTKSIQKTAEIVCHEAMHRKLRDSQYSLFDEEVECFKAEQIFRKGVLTEDDVSSIMTLVAKLYPEYVT